MFMLPCRKAAVRDRGTPMKFVSMHLAAWTVLLFVASALAGCNTLGGLGKDAQAVGGVSSSSGKRP
jgi:predicted small secreted protein